MSKLDSVSMSKFKNTNFEMWIEDDIFHVLVLVDTFTLTMAEECVRERMRMTHGKPYPMLSDSRKVTDFKKEAREYLSINDHILNLKAGAILIESQLQKILGGFFLLINKPNVPARLFTDREKALIWLEQFKI